MNACALAPAAWQRKLSPVCGRSAEILNAAYSCVWVVQVGADGAGSKVLAALEEQNLGRVRNKQLQELAKNTRVYKTVMMPSPEGEDDSSTTFSERSAGGRVLESLPTVEGAVSLVHRK